MLTPTEIVQRAREATGHPTHGGSPRRSAPRVPFALLVTGLLVGSLALLLALNTASAANELRRHAMVQKDAVVAARLQDLKVKVAASAAPANLARAAAELGMVPGGNPAFVVIGPDGKAVVMGKPKAVTAAPVKVPKAPEPTTSATPTTTATSAKPSTSVTPTVPVARPTSTPTATPSTTPTTTTRTSSAPARSTPAPRPTPTTTPTPVVTLPGGTR